MKCTLKLPASQMSASICGGIVGIICATLKSWPSLLRVQETYTGVSVSDSGFVAGKFEALVHAGMTPFSNASIQQIGWPTGIKNLGALNLISPLSTTVTWIGSILVGGIATQFLLGFIGITMTAAAGAHFVYRHGRNMLVSTLIAIPLAVSAPMNHWWQGVPTYTQGWIYILLIDAAIQFQKDVSREATRKFSVTLLLGLLWSPYVGVFCLVLALAPLLGPVLTQLTLRSAVRSALVLVPSLALVLFYGLIRRFFPDQVPVRTSQDAADHALRLRALWETDSAFYIGRGLFALMLAGLMAVCLLSICAKRRTFKVPEATLLASSSVILMFFLKSDLIPTFWKLIPTLVPQIRQGRYAGQIVQILCALATGVLLSRVLLPNRQRIITIALAISLVAVGIEGNRSAAEDIGRWMTPTSVNSKSIQLLRSLPHGAAAHFPWDMSAEIGVTSDPTPCLAQRIHRKPIVNVCDYNVSPTTLLRSLQQLQPCQQLVKLDQSGVRYIIVSVAYAQPRLLNCLGDRNTPNFVGLLYDDGQAQLWRLN